jgi:hypothetical protein
LILLPVKPGVFVGSSERSSQSRGQSCNISENKDINAAGKRAMKLRKCDKVVRGIKLRINKVRKRES